MGQSRPLFVYFRSFLVTISIWKSIDGVLGIQTRGRRMVGADETMELWRPPKASNTYIGDLLLAVGWEGFIKFATSLIFPWHTYVCTQSLPRSRIKLI